MQPNRVRVGTMRLTSIFTTRVMKFIDNDHVQLKVSYHDPRDSEAVTDGPYLLPMSVDSFACLDAAAFEVYLRRQVSALQKVIAAAIWCGERDYKGQSR